MITYRFITIEEIDFLVQLRLDDLAMFSDTSFPDKYIKNIRNFYEQKMKENDCFTIVANVENTLIATGTVYFYDCLPSNQNPLGRVGYITNIWTDQQYRRQGVASKILDQLMEIAKNKCNVVCLSTSEQGEALYLKKGFVKNKDAMQYIFKNT